MRKCSLIAILAVATWSVAAHAAPAGAKKKAAADSTPFGGPAVQQQSVGPCVQPCSYFENFDDVADFVAGTWLGNGLNGAAGGIFETWDAACSAASGATSEGHVETANPFSGTQHIRLAKDPAAGTNPFGCVVDARVPANTVAEANTPPVTPTTVSAQIAISTTFGADFNLQPQARWMGFLTTRILYFYAGFRYILDDPGTGLTFVFGGTWDNGGAYNNYTIATKPCDRFICLGGSNAGAACSSPLDCPDGGECAGRIDYLDNSGLYYQGSLYAGLNVDQFLLYSDNILGSGAVMDVDDVSITRDENPCPQICGDDDITGGEECEPAGGLDFACPGRCVPAGGTGANGEAECTCEIGPCSVSRDLPNGGPQTYGPADDNFGWFTFVADAPAYAVETCGTADYDSALSVWVGTCDSLALAPGNHAAGIAYNDDCYGGPNFGSGSDPLASCYNGPTALYAPYNSCLCLDTSEGTQYWIWDPRVEFGVETVITLTKRLACDNADQNFGACCDPFTGGCTDVASAADCDPRGTFTATKTCAGVGDQCPAASLGACCDRLTASCSETTEAGCTGNATFSLGTRCGPGVCVADKGACCVQTPFDGTCTVTKDVDCTGVFTVSATCDDVACGPEVIPTVSEWGLVIMALLLLIGAKVYFGRREAVA